MIKKSLINHELFPLGRTDAPLYGGLHIPWIDSSKPIPESWGIQIKMSNSGNGGRRALSVLGMVSDLDSSPMQKQQQRRRSASQEGGRGGRKPGKGQSGYETPCGWSGSVAESQETLNYFCWKLNQDLKLMRGPCIGEYWTACAANYFIQRGQGDLGTFPHSL